MNHLHGNQSPPSLDIIPSLVDDCPSLLNDIFSTKLIGGVHQYPPYLINVDVFNPSLLPITDLISPPTSDDESILNNEVPFTDICNSFFDIYLLKTVDDISEIPSNAKPAFVIMDLEKTNVSSTKEIAKKLSRNEQHISPIEIILFEEEHRRFALCKFENLYQCQYLYQNIFHSNERLAHYCFDATDMNNSKWFSVVIRNIPFANKKNFEEVYLSDFNDTIDHTFSAIVIRDSLCAMVVMKSIEAAERLCKVLNGKNGMKAHLHYKCCKMRDGKVNQRLYGKGGKRTHKKNKSNVIDMLLKEQRKFEKKNIK